MAIHKTNRLKIPVYSQGTTFSNESASNTICTDDGQQTLPFTKENNDQISNSSINTSGVSAFLITKTERGGECIMENNFVYTKHCTVNNKVHWQCIERGICKARLHTCGDLVVSRSNEHNHESNYATFHCSKMKTGMKRKAAETQEGTHSILTNSLSQLPEASAVKLPRLESLKQTVRRERKRTANVPPEPSSLNSLEIPDTYKITDKGQHFLLYDSGSVTGNQRILIFGTE